MSSLISVNRITLTLVICRTVLQYVRFLNPSESKSAKFAVTLKEMRGNKMGKTEKHVVINGVRLRYFDWGNEGKSTMVCLHGHTGDASIWNEFADAMSSHYHVLTVDQRGHGGSGWAEDGYSRDHFVEDLEAFIDTLDLIRVTLVGLSMGGWNTLLYTPLHPNIVEKAVIVDIAPEASEASKQMWGTRPSTPLEFDSFEHALRWGREYSPWSTDERYQSDMSAKLHEREDGLWTWNADPVLYNMQLEDNRSEDLINRYWNSLSLFTCPILEVRGGESLLVSDAIIDRMKQVNEAHFRSVTVKGAGHVVPVDQPKEFIDVVGQFLGIY
jgi:pimeloyl-ACP methyl ester carboxylesterase